MKSDAAAGVSIVSVELADVAEWPMPGPMVMAT
jgi:hypothetical protein